MAKQKVTGLRVRPIDDRILVEAMPTEDRSAGGIIIPDSAKERPNKGKIIVVGPGTIEDPMTLKPGDIVLYGKYAGVEVNLKGSEYLIMKQSDIFAVLEEVQE